MCMIAEREVGRFYAEDDLGKRDTVVRWQDMIVFRPSSRAGKENPRAEFATTGEQLDSRANGSLLIVNDRYGHPHGRVNQANNHSRLWRRAAAAAALPRKKLLAGVLLLARELPQKSA